MLQQILSIGGFSVLAGFFGFGLTWLVVGITGAVRFKTSNQIFDFAAKSFPMLIAGGIVGSIIGFVYALKTASAGPKATVKFERKYVGSGGRIRIYMGLPLLVTVLLTPVFGRLPRLVGEKYFIYVVLGIVLAVVALSLFLYDRIPQRWVMPIGIIGWLLTLALAVWYCFFGPGAFGHHAAG